jgi:hypothetical protein
MTDDIKSAVEAAKRAAERIIEYGVPLATRNDALGRMETWQASDSILISRALLSLASREAETVERCAMVVDECAITLKTRVVGLSAQERERIDMHVSAACEVMAEDIHALSQPKE